MHRSYSLLLQMFSLQGVSTQEQFYPNSKNSLSDYTFTDL